MVLIADSGSTKTAWCVADTIPFAGANPTSPINPVAGINPILTMGINPYQQSEDDIRAILQKELLPALNSEGRNSRFFSMFRKTTPTIKAVYFYGAGCTPECSPIVARALAHVLQPLLPPEATICVESDMLGAARSVCGHQPGIVGILGTGSNSAFYDGQQLHPGIPSLGYILGDEGSGAYLGRRLVNAVMKRQLPDELCQAFLDETHQTAATLIQQVYRQPLPNRFLASLSPFCARHRQHREMEEFLVDCFAQFFQLNILPAIPIWQKQTLQAQQVLHPGSAQTGLAIESSPKQAPTVHFVGSIAHHYRHELEQAAATCGCHVGNIVPAPLEGLVKYHQKGKPSPVDGAMS